MQLFLCSALYETHQNKLRFRSLVEQLNMQLEEEEEEVQTTAQRSTRQFHKMSTSIVCCHFKTGKNYIMFCPSPSVFINRHK